MSDRSFNRDPLADLQRAWHSDAPEAPLPPGFDSGSLDDCDAATQASVAWLRAAHRARTEASSNAQRGVPPAVQLAHLRARRRAERRALTRPLLVVAALAAAALLLITVRSFDRAGIPNDDAFDPETPVATGESGATSPPARTTEVPKEDFQSRDDGIEIVRGNVRLVLLNR